MDSYIAFKLKKDVTSRQQRWPAYE